MKYDENINRLRYSSHRIQCNTFNVFLSNFRLCSKTVRKVITVVSYYVIMCGFPEDVLCLRCEKPRPPFLWCVVLTLSPPSGCQWLPRGEYSRGEGQPAGWYPHLHRHDSSQRSRGQNAPPQGRLGDWEITRHTVTAHVTETLVCVLLRWGTGSSVSTVSLWTVCRTARSSPCWRTATGTSACR